MTESKPQIENLRELYSRSKVARAFFDHAARRERDQSETKVDRILTLLQAEGNLFSRSEMIALFKEIEKYGCGQFVEGRRGWPSRFVWSVGLPSVGRAASGKSQEIGDLLNDTIDETAANATLVQINEIDSQEQTLGDSYNENEVGETGLEEEQEEDVGTS